LTTYPLISSYTHNRDDTLQIYKLRLHKAQIRNRNNS